MHEAAYRNVTRRGLMNRLEGRSVIVTGAAQGIGSTFAEAVAAEGARVTVCDILSTEETVASIHKLGGQAIGYTCDITDGKAVERMVLEVVSTHGGLHGLVNNAALFSQLPKRPS